MKHLLTRIEDFRLAQIKQGAAFNTARARANHVREYHVFLLAQNLAPEQSDYNKVMEYCNLCRQSGNSPHTVRLKVKSLYYFFEYIQMPENPASLVNIKGDTKKVPQHLLSREQLNDVYFGYPSAGITAKRNKVLLSFVLFQGLASSELGLLQVEHLNLAKASLYVPSSPTFNARVLALESPQLLLLQDYLLHIRPELLKSTGEQTSRLLVGHLAMKADMKNVISRMMKLLKIHFPYVRSLSQLRQSVITLNLEQHGLRKAQYMAGHKYVSSTERYDTQNTEELSEQIRKFFPF